MTSIKLQLEWERNIFTDTVNLNRAITACECFSEDLTLHLLLDLIQQQTCDLHQVGCTFIPTTFTMATLLCCDDKILSFHLTVILDIIINRYFISSFFKVIRITKNWQVKLCRTTNQLVSDCSCYQKL